jgi:hypothetical protein
MPVSKFAALSDVNVVICNAILAGATRREIDMVVEGVFLSWADFKSKGAQ